ncbi:hypothetical protein Pmani_036775 [Petrolisthes manimaculis]|uniref:Uncharacterized protein n=1 Tax=Petrolisthes manimaculis TaxID=1843537 RepID=A0AAE1TLU2_9EUCA|nr:hypothetical protein Pmani_036775 [Petrolisthes manimaculis]
MRTRVSLQDNRLVEIPGSSLCLLTSVTWLDLRYNQLTCLPHQIGSLATLQVLLLQGNNLTVLPSSLGILSELVTLQVSDNPLSFPPAAVIREGTRAILSFLRDHMASQSCQPSLPGPGRDSTTIVYCFGDIEGHRRRDNPGNCYDESDTGTDDDDDDDFEDDAMRTDNSEGVEIEGSGDDGGDGEHVGMCGGGGEGVGDTGVWKSLERNNTKESEASVHSSPTRSAAGGLRVAIRSHGDHSDTLEEEYQKSEIRLLHLRHPDSERDTLGRPHTPISPCLLTPNADFPSRPEYDLQLMDNPKVQGHHHLYDPKNDSTTTTTTTTIYHSTSNTRDKTRCGKNTDADHHQHRPPSTYPLKHDPLEDDTWETSPNNNNNNNNENNNSDTKTQDGIRRSLHLRLQEDHHLLHHHQDEDVMKDDLESLEGDLGEGYRRPSSRLEDLGGEANKDARSLPLPVVRLQLVEVEEQKGRTAAEGRGSGDSRKRYNYRRGSEQRSYSGNRRKPKLVTVAEVHRRARDARRKQREVLTKAREATETQRLKTVTGLYDWREETRSLQEQRQLYHTLYPGENSVGLGLMRIFGLSSPVKSCITYY